MRRNKHNFASIIVKHIVSVLAMVSLVASLALPEAVEAKGWDGVIGFMSHFNSIQLALAANDTPSFPESDERAPVKTVWVIVTAYNSVPGQTDSTPCITANGYDLCKQYAEQGFGNTIAANFMQFGTVVRLPEIFGNKEFVVRDRMNARYGYGRMDIWLPTMEEARAFGVQKVKMEIYN